MAKIMTVNLAGEIVAERHVYRCHDCNDCPYNKGIAVEGCSNVLPCGQYHCWDDLVEHDCESCFLKPWCKEVL